MKRCKVLTLLFSTVLAFSLTAQIPEGFYEVNETKQVKNLVTENATLTSSMSSDFIQEKHLTMMEEVLISKGRFLFKKENHVRWEYTSPINYAILISNNEFSIDNDGKVSTFDTESNKLFKEINNMILMAIQGNFVNDPDFKAKFYENKSLYLAQLTPQDEILKNILETIEIYFDKSDMAVRKIKFIEPEEDFTLIKFTNRKKNITINDDQFQITR